MSVFTEKELQYLQSARLGRLATVGADGMPHVVPTSFRYNPAHDTIDIGGHDFSRASATEPQPARGPSSEPTGAGQAAGTPLAAVPPVPPGRDCLNDCAAPVIAPASTSSAR